MYKQINIIKYYLMVLVVVIESALSVVKYQVQVLTLQQNNFVYFY